MIRYVLLFAVACADTTTPDAQLVLVETASICQSDADCSISHNTCESTAHCSHVDDVPGTIDQVCDPDRYTTPDAARCGCDDAGLCAVMATE